MESTVKSAAGLAKGTPEEESNISLYKSSPFFPHLTQVHFYLDNPSIPLEVRKNMIQLQGAYTPSSTLEEDGHSLLLLERYATQGEHGSIHEAVEGTLISWMRAMVTKEEGNTSRQGEVTDAWSNLDKELISQGATGVKLFSRHDLPRPKQHPIIAAIGGKVGSMINLARAENYEYSTVLDTVKEIAWEHHENGCWESYQHHQMERHITEMYLDSLIAKSGIHELGEVARSYRQQVASNARARSTTLKLSQELLEIDYSMVSTLLALSTQVEKLHILKHHERVTPEAMGEFTTLVREYNLEWAIAAMDWEKGESSRVNRINYGHGEAAEARENEDVETRGQV